MTIFYSNDDNNNIEIFYKAPFSKGPKALKYSKNLKLKSKLKFKRNK